MSKNQPTETQHANIWGTIDAIAKANNMSISRLAVASGMDSTSFNKSKRATKYKLRMPTVETLLSIMNACNMDWFQWAEIFSQVSRTKKGRK